ncbi:unnamed protein product [Nyctereutes procyonoides]|uniref:(raccoon dog) hypothetical protein n=1 Tax=Nyctereutes procyonoides TaxID=34880 RepID=A0A811YBM1_NYCPR|nr:unnamed protein product [Nyctereutes procyonoides]
MPRRAPAPRGGRRSRARARAAPRLAASAPGPRLPPPPAAPPAAGAAAAATLPPPARAAPPPLRPRTPGAARCGQSRGSPRRRGSPGAVGAAPGSREGAGLQGRGKPGPAGAPGDPAGPRARPANCRRRCLGTPRNLEAPTPPRSPPSAPNTAPPDWPAPRRATCPLPSPRAATGAAACVSAGTPAPAAPPGDLEEGTSDGVIPSRNTRSGNKVFLPSRMNETFHPALLIETCCQAVLWIGACPL